MINVSVKQTEASGVPGRMDVYDESSNSFIDYDEFWRRRAILDELDDI